ncbi:XkdX family protein [Lysinibacillus sp. UBA5994]
MMEFWQIAFMFKWVTAEQLKIAVKTEANPYGEITPKQYKEITGQNFETQAKA